MDWEFFHSLPLAAILAGTFKNQIPIMEIKEYRIRNYKAINDVTLNLNYSIIPIIGVNEAGKTSILQAILAFDKNRDKINSGNHLEFQNKYSIKDTRDCKISAKIKLEKSEIKQLYESIKMRFGQDFHTEVSKIKDTNVYILTRELSTADKDYFLEDSEFDEKIKKEIKKYIQKRLPFILYFDDFTDRVPDVVSFKEDYKTTGKLIFSKNKEWQEIIIEIFRRAEVEGMEDDNPLIEFFNKEDRDRRSDILSDIEGILNKEIINEWKRIKKSGHKNFADDSENLSLQLTCEEQTFTFKVKDTSNQDKKRTFNVSERSKGFQWFFNYMIKLKFNPRYKGKKENSIFLLDEPGSYLHSSAQSELLEELKNVSKNNTIIYCTHSQYLLNPKTIRLGSIRIAEKESSVVKLYNYGNYKSKDDKGALSAVYQALNLNFSRDFVGKIVITEGVTDFYFFNMLKTYTKLIKNEFVILPGAGSGNSSNLISLALSFSENFVLLFDNDQGKEAFKNYKNQFGEDLVNRYFHLYNSTIKFALEDFLAEKDKKKLLDITKTDDLKRAFAFLYYDVAEIDRKEYFSNLEKQTLKDLENTIDRLNIL